MTFRSTSYPHLLIPSSTIRPCRCPSQSTRATTPSTFPPTTQARREAREHGISLQRSRIVTLRKALQQAKPALKDSAPASTRPRRATCYITYSPYAGRRAKGFSCSLTAEPGAVKALRHLVGLSSHFKHLSYAPTVVFMGPFSGKWPGQACCDCEKVAWLRKVSYLYSGPKNLCYLILISVAIDDPQNQACSFIFR